MSVSVAQNISQISPQGDTVQENGKVYYMVFALLLSAMLVRQQTIGVESKEIDVFAKAQKETNDELAALKYQSLPPGKVTQEQIAEVETYNEHVSNQKQELQRLGNGLQQGARIEFASANANVSLVGQEAAEDTGLLKTYNVIFKLINSITKPQ